MRFIFPIIMLLYLFLIKEAHILPLLILTSASFLRENRKNYKIFLFVLGLALALYFDSSFYAFVMVPLAISKGHIVYMLILVFYLVLNKKYEPAFLTFIMSFATLMNDRLEIYQKKSEDLYLDLHMRQEKEAKYKKEELLRMDRQNELSRLEERSRISSELHHIIGHTITTALMRLEIIKIKSEEEKTKQDIDIIKNELSASMDEIRKTIHKMKDESIDLKKELKLLNVEGGLEIRYDLQFTSMEPEMGKNVLNLVKEAITNTRKHSNAKRIQIRIHEEKTFYRIEIIDDGTNKGEIKEGLGLQSMSDLAKKYGGYFSTEWMDGFRIFITLKKEWNTSESYSR